MTYIASGIARLAAAGAALAVPAFSMPAAAQSSMGSREFQLAELNELPADVRAEVLRRAVDGNTPRGVLEVMLLNSMQQRFPASRIVAVDMGRGVAVIETPQKQLKALTFNKQQGLQVVGEVVLQ